MRILHLFSDWKWTGPAEPTVSLCEALWREGVDVTLAYRKTPIDFPERTVEKAVKGRGIPGFDGLRLSRYFSLKDWLFDVRAIKAYVRQHRVDVVHANLSHDHYTAIASLAFSGKKPLIVRTDHKRDGLAHDAFMKRAFGRTDGLVTYSRRIMENDIAGFAFPSQRTCVIPPGIEAYTGPIRDMRGELGIAPGERVIGVIGRLKPDRGYDVILKGFKLLRQKVGGVKLLIMGRSSQIEKSIIEPLTELGLQQDVILAGYRIEEYFSIISLFDIFVMMRAGSDGTARALREVMAMGKPAIVSDLGMLPELVEEAVTGFVVKPDGETLAARMETLIADGTKREAFGRKARERASEKWSYREQARTLGAFYEHLIKQGPR
jgi:glycosyltransferase involved in cell wall biosynthesis